MHPSFIARLAVFLVAMLTGSLSWAAVGKVVIAQGEVYALDANAQQRILKRRSDVFEGDTIVTGADGAIQIRFQDNAILALREESQLKITEYHGSEQNNGSERVLMDLLAGGFRTITGSIGKTDKDAYQVRTPNASIGIRGTHYEALLNQSSLLLGVYQGGIRVRNETGQIDLGADSQFFFARVAPGGRPQGLLNPPEELNTPLSPGNEEGGEPQPEEEPSARLNDEESEGIPLEEAFNQPIGEEPPVVPTTETESTQPTLVTDIQFTGVAASLTDTASETDNGDGTGDGTGGETQNDDLRLTDAQIDSLTQSPKPGLVVLTNSGGDAVHYGYVVDGVNGPVFVNYDTENMTELADGYVSPDRVFKGPETLNPIPLASHQLQDTSVEWGIWNASATDPGGLYQDPNLANPAETHTDPFYYVVADVVNVADRTGMASFDSYSCESSSGGAPCWSVSTSLGEVTSFSGSLSVDFDTATGNGYISMATDTDKSWSADFEGSLQGSQFMADTVTSSYLYNLDNTFMDSTGELNGYFTGGADQLYFVGGFNLESQQAGEHAEGVMLLQEYLPQ